MGRRLVVLIGESLQAVVPGFNARRFRARAARDVDALELEERATHIAQTMAGHLPESFDDLVLTPPQFLYQCS